MRESEQNKPSYTSMQTDRKLYFRWNTDTAHHSHAKINSVNSSVNSRIRLSKMNYAKEERMYSL